MAVDRFESELKSKYKDEHKFWDDYFKARDEYYINTELEKQSEQMPAKEFKIGDWVVSPNGVYWHIDAIQDAKDGDVLACNNGWTCIFKTLVNDETFSSYCFMDSTKWFCETGGECHTLREEFVISYNGKMYPATKEQRDLLFAKMKELGYEWDAEKKQIIKL